MLKRRGIKRVIGEPTDKPSGNDLRVMFDPQIFCHQRFGGISRYVCNIALEMQRMPGVTPQIIAPFHFNEYLISCRVLSFAEGGCAARGPHCIGLRIERYPWQSCRSKSQAGCLAQYLLLSGQAAQGFPRHPDRLRHDPREVSQVFAASPFITRIKAASVAAADHVICISESTRRDLLATYDIPEERVSVTHLGFDPLGSLLSSESSGDFKIRALGSNASYLLYVGSRVNYKNFKGLLDAYAASASLRSNFFLLCFGGGDFTGAERAAISKAGLKGVSDFSGVRCGAGDLLCPRIAIRLSFLLRGVRHTGT